MVGSARDGGLERLLEEAAKSEKEFDWLKAVYNYEAVLSTQEAKDSFRQGMILESIGYARFKAALQSDSPEEFRDRIGLAIESCEKARRVFEEQDDPKYKPWQKRCEATLAYLGFWLATERMEKRKNLANAWDLTRESLAAFSESRDGLEYCKTFLKLSLAGQLSLSFIQDFQARKNLSDESVAAGEKALRFMSDIGDDSLCALVYARMACITGLNWVAFEPSLRDLRVLNQSMAYWTKASETSETSILDEFSSQIAMGVVHVPVNSLSKETRPFMVRALERARATRDKFQIGCVLAELANFIAQDMNAATSDTEVDELFERSVRYGGEAKDCFTILMWPILCASEFWIPEPDFIASAVRADVEADLSKKRRYAERAFDCAKRSLSLAEESECVDCVMTSNDYSSYAIGSLAKCENEPQRKKDLLEQALRYRRKSLQFIEALNPFGFASIGWNYATLSELEFELQLTAVSSEDKRRTLEDAIQHMEKGLELWIRPVKEAPSVESQIRGEWTHAMCGRWAHDLGIWLASLGELIQDKKPLERSIQAFNMAADFYLKANSPSRRAEIFWEIARTESLMDDHTKASDFFLRASDEFDSAVKKVPRLKEICEDHSTYMRAWAEIEQARHGHSRQDYGHARTHYDKAAELHSRTRRWNYLSMNYRAWAQVEGGEDLSRNDDPVGAAQAFKLASDMFVKSVESIEPQIPRTEDSEERRMAEALVKAAAIRRKYCDARIVLEEARDLEKKGEGHQCSDRYGQVASILQDIERTLDTDQDKKEIELILILTKAWQAMCRADAEESSDSYSEASVLFEKAKELSSGEKAKLIAMGHSRFCKALEAGTRFTDTGDSVHHTAATQHLESAARYYLKAGLESASKFANASKLLFDGYVCMGDASREKDQSKKAKLYAMAEKVFQASAAEYNKAGYAGKKAHVEKLLEKVSADRELAVSLTEVLSAPDVISNTVAFTSPTPTHERATGIKTFEHAYVQATLIARPRDLRVGEDLSLDIELVNAGRTAAQLTKVEEIAPSGFDILDVPEKYRVEDSYLNMRGWKLDALKTEDVRLVLKPTRQGRFMLKPRVMYMDESGKYKSCELAPVEVTVKELGISGWLKGPDRRS